MLKIEKPETSSAHLSVLIQPSQLAQIKKIQKENDCSRAQAVRALLNVAFKTLKKDQEANA